MNKIYLEGIVKLDAKTVRHPNGNIFSSFVVATSDTFTCRRSGKRINKVEYHNCYAIAKIADLVDRLVRKDRAVFMEGSVEYDKNEDGRLFTIIRTNYIKVTERILTETPQLLAVDDEKQAQSDYAKKVGDYDDGQLSI